MQLVDPMSGEVSKACLFVAALPFSRYSYAEPTLDMKQDAWLRCHVHAEERGLDRVLIGELATCGFATRGQDVVLFGPAGTGKTCLACALAKEACASRVRADCIRCPDFEEAWKDAQERPGGVAKAVRKYGAFQVLVLDEWLLSRPDDGFRRFLLEIFELRYDERSTIFCTQ